jgi:ATP-dependent DNA helicase PIF1
VPLTHGERTPITQDQVWSGLRGHRRLACAARKRIIECQISEDAQVEQDELLTHNRCILSPRNREANEINDFVLEQFPGESHDLWSVDKAFNPDTEMVSEDPYLPELLHSLTPSGFPLARLKLKIGCPVIVLRNLHSAEGVCNRSQGVVTQISTRVVEVLLHNGTSCLIPRVKLICSNTQLPFHLHRLQFPLVLSFAITINKAQGQSFATVGIDLRIPTFAHGQVYVAFSRGKSCKRVKCVLNESTTPFTKNVVYREAIF